MKIRTQLIISMVFFVIALLIISASVIITNQQVEQLNKQQEIVKNVELKAGDLSYLSNDYLLYRERQQIDRWNSKYSSFSSDISNLRTDNPDQQVIINNIKVNQQRLNETFEGIVSSSSNTSSGQLNALGPEFAQVSSSRLGVQTQGIVFDASRLSQELHDEENQLNQLNILLISALLGTVVAFLLTNYFLIYRRTLTAMSNLQVGTRIIGSGNLDHTIEEEQEDEFGELSQAFNQMTARLKTITASKADLEIEITERKKAEEDLRKSEKRYRELFNNPLTGFALHEIKTDNAGNPVDYVFLAANNAFERFTELKVEDIIGKRVTEVLPGIDESDFIEKYGNVALNGEPVSFEQYSPPLDKYFDIVAFSPQKGQFATFFTDITKRRKAEDQIKNLLYETQQLNEELEVSNEELQSTTEELHRSYDELDVRVNERTAELQVANKELEIASIYNRSLIESSLDPLVTIGSDGKINDVNSSTEAVTGYHRDKLIGTDFSDYFTEHEKARSGYKQVFREGFVRDYPLEIKHKDGYITPVLYNATVYKDKSGEVIGVFAAARDITEIKQAEEHLMETVNELERSNEELQSFAYITSHDLQEPLRSIASYAQLLQRRYEGQLDDDADEFIDFMVAGATRMKQQIQGLLDYSRLGTRGEEFNEFSAEEALNNVLSNLQSAIKECNVEITHESLPKIVADESQIIRVFQNLIGNALKFHREGVKLKIHIKARKTDDGYVFSVSDNGIGMEPQYTDRIFEVFKRLHPIGEYQRYRNRIIYS